MVLVLVLTLMEVIICRKFSKMALLKRYFFDAVSSTPENGAFVGSVNEQVLSGATVAVREYKKPTVSMTSPVIAWDNTLKNGN